MFSVYQHWDPLKTCVVGRSYPPEFYSWIKVPHVRELFERIAQETEEDFQSIIKKLGEFGVEVLRPNLPQETMVNGRYMPPPMTPRDYMVMVGNVFYQSYAHDRVSAYQQVKDDSWPVVTSEQEFEDLPSLIKQECDQLHNFSFFKQFYSSYDEIFDQIKHQGNQIRSSLAHSNVLNGAMISRIGRDLYFGTPSHDQEIDPVKTYLTREFQSYRVHTVDTRGHSDGTYCPVCPGLIISLNDVPTYTETFPDWEVVYLPNQSWDLVKSFGKLKAKNYGKWWIPGFEEDQSVIETVETWLSHWTGYVEETVFDVNMLIIDPKNVIVFNHNDKVFNALGRYGITPHVVPFRHRYFWDGGIHCVTADLHRDGKMKDYFPKR